MCMLRPGWRQADHWLMCSLARIMPAHRTTYAVNPLLLGLVQHVPARLVCRASSTAASLLPFPSAQRDRRALMGYWTPWKTEIYSFLRILEQETRWTISFWDHMCCPWAAPQSVLHHATLSCWLHPAELCRECTGMTGVTKPLWCE